MTDQPETDAEAAQFQQLCNAVWQLAQDTAGTSVGPDDTYMRPSLIISGLLTVAAMVAATQPASRPPHQDQWLSEINAYFKAQLEAYQTMIDQGVDIHITLVKDVH